MVSDNSMFSFFLVNFTTQIIYDQTDLSLKKSFIRSTSTSRPKDNPFPFPTPSPVLQCNGIISDNSRSISVPINLLFVFRCFNQFNIHLI